MNKYTFLLVLALIVTLNIFSQNYYMVKEGDTLYQISKKFNISVESLKEINNIKDITNLKVGVNLLVSEEKSASNNDENRYIVKKGDTLFSISRKFNISLALLLEYNNLVEGDVISLGQELLIKPSEEIKDVVITETDSNNYIPYWPVEGNIKKYSGRIQGVLISGKSGDYIQAVSSGRVVWYDSFKGIGKVVLIEGVNGYDYLYGTNEDLSVRMGLEISAGDKIGRLNDDATEVVFSVFRNGKPLNDITNAPR